MCDRNAIVQGKPDDLGWSHNAGEIVAIKQLPEVGESPTSVQERRSFSWKPSVSSINLARMPTELDHLVKEFVTNLSDAIEAEASRRVESAVRQALGGAMSGGMFARRRGRPPGRASVGRPAAATRSKRPVSPARRLQGQYLGRLRALKGGDRARVKAMAKEKGVAEAGRLADSILRG
jgi:hypothetical protein